MNKGIGNINEFATYHPGVIFTYFFLVMGVTMTTYSPGVFAVSVVCAWAYSIYLKGKSALKFNFAVTLAIILFTATFNTLFTHDGQTVLLYINANRITTEALVFGIYSGLMLSTVVIWFSSFNKIVSSEMIMYLFSKVSSIFGLMISMIFRYIPMLKLRYDEISMGQHCIGKEQGNSLPGKIGQVVKKISILISWSLESSIETADSMAARGYGLSGRSSFHLYKWSVRDVIVILLMVAAFAAGTVVALGGNTEMVFYPKMKVPGLTLRGVCETLAFAVYGLMPMIIDICGEYRWKKLESKI
jgi:energy-coupling factor transport system permease protein